MPVYKDEIKSILFNYARDQFSIDDENFSSEESDLFENGYVDSLNLETLFSFIEDTFDVIFQEEQFLDERISTISGIADIIIELKGN